MRCLLVASFVALAAAACGSSTDPADEGGDSVGQGDQPQAGDNDASNDDTDTAGPIDDGPGHTAGNGVCEPPETPANTPDDCPAVAGDALCTSPENAQTTPQDCPAVAGDGFCTHDETFITVPQDCPPPDFVYTSGGLGALLAVSPPLRFRSLTIQGTLTLTPETTTTVEAETFNLSGTIDTAYAGACDDRDGPTFALVGADTATITGTVSFRGQSGNNVSSGSSCSCYGSNGGKLEVTATAISFSGALSAPGGSGGKIILDVDTDQGCAGGDGGSVLFHNTTLAATSGGSMNIDGGRGGNTKVLIAGFGGSVTIVEGGKAGVFVTDGGSASFPERPIHASRQDAQVIGVKSRVTGIAKSPGDFTFNNLTDQTVYITSDKTRLISDNVKDNLEDLYRVRNPGPSARTYAITLGPIIAADSGTGDLDLVVVDRVASQVLGLSDHTGNTLEQLSISVGSGQEIIIGVSTYLANSRRYRLTVD